MLETLMLSAFKNSCYGFTSREILVFSLRNIDENELKSMAI